MGKQVMGHGVQKGHGKVLLGGETEASGPSPWTSSQRHELTRRHKRRRCLPRFASAAPRVPRQPPPPPVLWISRRWRGRRARRGMPPSRARRGGAQGANQQIFVTCAVRRFFFFFFVRFRFPSSPPPLVLSSNLLVDTAYERKRKTPLKATMIKTMPSLTRPVPHAPPGRFVPPAHPPTCVPCAQVACATPRVTSCTCTWPPSG